MAKTSKYGIGNQDSIESIRFSINSQIMNWLDIVFCLSVILGGFTALSMEYYARKSGVSASPSVPWMRKALIEELTKSVKETGRESQPLIIYELGSGWGTLALAAAKAHPNAHVIGYEISIVPLFFSKIRAILKRQKNITFTSQSFFDSDFGKADYFLTYLLEPLMEKVGEKMSAEARDDAIAICNTFIVPQFTPDAVRAVQNFVYELNIYIYKMASQRK